MYSYSYRSPINHSQNQEYFIACEGVGCEKKIQKDIAVPSFMWKMFQSIS